MSDLQFFGILIVIIIIYGIRRLFFDPCIVKFDNGLYGVRSHWCFGWEFYSYWGGTPRGQCEDVYFKTKEAAEEFYTTKFGSHRRIS